MTLSKNIELSPNSRRRRQGFDAFTTVTVPRTRLPETFGEELAELDELGIRSAAGFTEHSKTSPGRNSRCVKGTWWRDWTKTYNAGLPVDATELESPCQISWIQEPIALSHCGQITWINSCCSLCSQ